MKNRNVFRFILFMLVLSLSLSQIVRGQAPPPPGGHGWNGNQGSGGSAPVDGGSLLLLLGGLGYGAYKVIRANKKKIED